MVADPRAQHLTAPIAPRLGDGFSSGYGCFDLRRTILPS
jgi:hypothetical protein